jgi:shikimate kinase
MPPTADAPIFLIGFMASGKTSVGKLLAARLGFAFVDLDEVIAAAAGATIPEIFAREGEAAFRRRESAAVRAAASEQRTVIATGGGAACREENLATMLGEGRVVALIVSAEEAVRRAGATSGRPLLDGQADPAGAARVLLAQRDPFYARAHVRVDTDGRAPDEIAEAVLRALAGTAGGGAPASRRR